MGYAVVSQFVALVGEAEARALATPAAPTPGYDATKIQGALDRASATLDSYFATRFTVPLNPVPDIVATNACRSSSSRARVQAFVATMSGTGFSGTVNRVAK